MLTNRTYHFLMRSSMLGTSMARGFAFLPTSGPVIHSRIFELGKACPISSK